MEGQELTQVFSNLNETLGQLREVWGAQGTVRQTEFCQELAQVIANLDATLRKLGELLGAQGAVGRIEIFQGQPKQ